MTVLGQLAEYLAMAPARTLSPPTRQRIATHVLDTIGCWIAGRATEEGFKLSKLTSGSPTGTSLLGNNPLDRITLGVATIRLTESDDIHMGSCTTPSSVIVPTCLTIAAQSETPNVENFARGLCAGYEIMTRFGVAIDGPHIVYRGVWPTFFLAPIAAAAVTAGVLGLNAYKTANALALALSLTSGALGAASGLSPRWLLLGLAARNGCAAALMAADGYAGDQSLLDGDWIARTHGVSCDVAQLSPSAWTSEAVDTISLKPYTAAKQCISAIEAFRNLLKQGVQPETITALNVHVPPVYAAMIAHGHAADGRIQRITSAAYNLALVAFRPDELYEISRSDLTTDTEIAAFMTRIRVFPDNELSNYYPGCWPARVDAELENGRIISSTLLNAPGDPADVAGWTGPIDKFHSITDEIVGRSRSMELERACLGATERNESLQQLCKWSSDCNWP